MLIRSQITRNGDGPLSGFVWAGETDPGWIRFRTDPRSGVMSGLHLTPCEGTVPRGTPFRFRFTNGEQAMRGSEGVAMLILLSQGLSVPALNDVALVLALLSALSIVAFVRRAWFAPGTGRLGFQARRGPRTGPAPLRRPQRPTRATRAEPVASARRRAPV